MRKVCVFMSTYNGEKYIEEQLDSVLNQENVDVILYIRDDGSTDNTCSIIENYQKKFTNIILIKGYNCGPAKSFWKLLQISREAEFYAFCDQDDIWLPNKLNQGIDCISEYMQIPALYYSKTKLVDENLKVIKNKYNSYKESIPRFGQLIAENNASGCTMIWNHKLQLIAKDTKIEYMRMHDHILFLICEFCNGYVYYDKNSYIKYRQHESNVISGKDTLLKYMRSVFKYLKADSGLALQSLELLNVKNINANPANIKLLYYIKEYKTTKKMYIRIRLIKLGFYKQKSKIKNILIGFMILLNRF